MTELSGFTAAYQQRLRNLARASCSEIAMRTQTRTPVLSGNLQGKWEPNKEPLTLNLGDVFEYTNRAPYARYIEYLGGGARNAPATQYATDAPYGMMRRSIAEWQQIVNEAIANGS